MQRAESNITHHGFAGKSGSAAVASPRNELARWGSARQSEWSLPLA